MGEKGVPHTSGLVSREGGAPDFCKGVRERVRVMVTAGNPGGQT
jgi:hypothetical protein